MEDGHKKTEQVEHVEHVEMITTSTFTQCCGVIDHEEGGKALARPDREEQREWDNRNVQRELRVLAWTMSLEQDHLDSGFFCGGECKKCSECSDEFNFLHYTSEKNAYCVRCYLEKFCDVVEDDTIFLVVIKKSRRILIEIYNPNE